MQVVGIPRDILRNLAVAAREQANSEEEFTALLGSLRQMPENTIGREVVRFIDTCRAFSMPFPTAS